MRPHFHPAARLVAAAVARVASAGLTLRVNLMGFAGGQLDAVRPFQRPVAGWVFQHLAPGF